METGPKPSLRDELLARAKLGEITPEEAEDAALLDGCGPLEVRSYPIDPSQRMEPADLDPITEPAWTLLMALVWIIARDPMAVRAVWVEARRACTHWVVFPLTEAAGTISEKRTSWELRPLPPPTVSDVDAVCEVDEDELLVEYLFPPIVVSGIRAREELWDRLCSGDLIAEGKRRGKSEGTKISPDEWTSLDWLDDRSASADIVGSRIDNVPRYDDVSVLGQKVRDIWKPLEKLKSENYEREDWSVDHATLWIAYGDPTLLHFVGLASPRAKRQLSKAECLDPQPRRTLLQALMNGKLRAIRNGEQMPPEQWFGKSLPRKQPEEKRTYFRRSDILREWPEREERLLQRLEKTLGGTISTKASGEREGNFTKAAGDKGIVSPTQPARKRGPKPVVLPRVLAAMQADKAQGKDVENMKYVEMAARYQAAASTCREARVILFPHSGDE